MNRAGRMRMAALLGVVLVLLGSCAAPANLPPGVINLIRPQPVITVQQAREVFDLLVSRRAVALHDGDAADLTGIETQPLLDSDRGVVAAEQHLYNADFIGSTFRSVTPFVPRFSSYPAWFMVEARRMSGGRILSIVARAGQKRPWTLQSAAVLDQQLPSSPSPAAQGFVRSGRFQRDLSTDLSNYFNGAENHFHTQNVLPGSLTSEAVQQDLKTISQSRANGWSVQNSFSPGPFSFTRGLQLRSGAVLGFASMGRQTAVSTLDEACFEENPTAGPTWSAVGGSGRVSAVNAKGINLYAVVESRSGDKVIGILGEYTTTDLTTC